MNRLDAHMHVWRINRADYDWLTPDLTALYRDFSVDNVWKEASACGVSKTILVQAAASVAETDFLLGLAASDPRIAGIVGWVEFEAADAAAQVRRHSEDARIVGLRPMIGDIADPNWILQGAFSPVLQAMVDGGLVFDAHARADLVSVMAKVADLHPDLQIVLNHGGKPRIAAHDLSGWFDDIAALAQRSNVACKFSGLLTEAGPRTDDASIGEVIAHLAATFGPKRLLWGSDWPVLTMAGSYAGWASQSERLIEQYLSGHADAIWRANAERIYFGWTGG